ncbi:hypothetical protein K503DRAFT_803062 [Rhizopogon vinicolor AM-OR11-026]|uniref:Uncharacterized protein n=1 Tax=Rhizopogon vinicolor AM-OR11-026 TaxID=1314800 RepID=A0A1B7MRB2_9AGAM|nr:hypothetical protein K503DRAFT_803062 [Rhizopogon vinicolor AM-OR11-026]
MSSGPNSLSKRPRPSAARRLWHIFIPSPPRLAEKEPIPLQQRPKRSLFSRHTGPRPVTIFAGRPRKLYWTAPRPVDRIADEGSGDTNARTGQSSSAAVQPSPVALPRASLQRPQRLQVQTVPATQPAHVQEEEYDYGCWGNFCHALWFIPRRSRRIVYVNQPAAS